MSVLISDAVNDILLETQTVGNRISIPDIILSFKRANEYLNSNYKMPTTERQSNLLVFSDIFEYPKPDDFIGWFEPMRPYGNLSPWFVNTTANELVHTYAGNQTAFRFDRENQFLIVSYENSQGNQANQGNIIINACDSLTENGTWSVSGDGSGLILDTQIFVQGSGSLRFLITDSSGTTVLTCVNQTPVDLATMIQQGFFFLDLECPDSNTSAISQVKLRLSSTSGLLTNYYEFTSSVRYRGDSIKNGWGPIGFNALDVVTNGSPDDDNLIYMTVTITNGVTGTSGIYRLDNIFAALPTYFQLPYYSKYNVKDDNGNYIFAPTEVSDTILCPDDFNNALIYRAIEHLCIYNLRDAGRASYFSNLSMPFENGLKIKYPSQERRVQNQYYRSGRSF